MFNFPIPVATLTFLGGLLLLGGCLKPSLATPESIRTGSGSLTRLLMPVPVPLPSGGTGVCAYVTRPSPDATSLERLGPTDTQGADVLTPQAILHADFIAQLRDPNRMAGLGGLGNDIITDLSAGAAAAAFAATAMPIGFQIGGLSSDAQQQWKAFKQASEAKLAGLFEMESLIESQRKDSVKQLSKSIRAASGNRVDGSALQAFETLLRDGHLGQNPGFHKRLLEHIASVSDPSQKQKTTVWLMNLLAETGSRRVSEKQARSLVDAMELALVRGTTTSPANARIPIERLAAELDDLGQSSRTLAGSIDDVRQVLSSLESQLRSGAGGFGAAIQTAARGVDEATGSASDIARNQRLLAILPNKVSYRMEVLGSLSPEDMMKVDDARRVASNFAKNGSGSQARVLSSTIEKRVSASMGDEFSGITSRLAGQTDEAARGMNAGRNILRRACFQGGARFAKLMGCGLILGFGTGFGVKKMVFEPASSGIKQDQIAQALAEAPGRVTDVNEETFNALAAAIRSFETSQMNTPCQQGTTGSLFSNETNFDQSHLFSDSAGMSSLPDKTSFGRQESPAFGGASSSSTLGGGAELDTNPVGSGF